MTSLEKLKEWIVDAKVNCSFNSSYNEGYYDCYTDILQEIDRLQREEEEEKINIDKFNENEMLEYSGKKIKEV